MKQPFQSLIILVMVLLIQSCAAIIVGGVASTAVVTTDRRTTGVFIEDENIEIKTNARLSENKDLEDKSHINVISYNGVVLLVGQTPTIELKRIAGEIARNVPSVKRVHNELRIAAPNNLITRSSDSYITSKIKTKMTFEKNFDSTAFKVVTENGEVFLMGLVTKDEAETAIAIAKNVDGVQKVIDVMEYIPTGSA